MIAQYAPSALWGLALLASFVGWGRLVASALGPRERAHVGLALVWGFAAVLALGGWLCLLGLAERNLLAALVAVGAFRALGYDGLAAVRPERSELLYKLATWTMHADGVRMSWHSDPAARGLDHDRPHGNAEAVAIAVEKLAPRAAAVVGMSLGGLTALTLAALRPALVRRVLLVDVTPGANAVKAEPIVAFVTGPESFASFDEILARTVAHNPTRSVASLRRGVLHNARSREDGRWVWRYDRLNRVRSAVASGNDLGFGVLWDDVGKLRVPLLLVRGALSGVVDDADVAELHRRKPDAEVVVVPDAGHSVQGDRPVELARIIERFALAQR